MSARKLGELVELTREMLEASRAGDWTGVALLQEQRQALIAARDTGPVADGDVLRQQLHEITVANGELLRVAASVRDRMRQELAALGRASHGAAVYARNEVLGV
jgi:hypothetical protein